MTIAIVILAICLVAIVLLQVFAAYQYWRIEKLWDKRVELEKKRGEDYRHIFRRQA